MISTTRLLLLTCLIGICLAADHNVPIPEGHKRGDANFATAPSLEVGKRHKSFKRGASKVYPFELGIGYYYQFDIMLKPESQQNAIPLTGKNADVRWPSAVVPYVIKGSFTDKEKANIQTAIKQYTDKTCVRFVPRTNEDLYVSIDNGASGCWSYIGRNTNNDYNLVNLQSPTCTNTGTIAHELMHSIGFYHEFTRPDRDNYISIDIGALDKKYQTADFFNANYAKLGNSQAELYGIPYNYGSVMHYSKWAGAVNYNRPVMNNLKSWDGDFGNTVGLTDTDAQQINYMYCNQSSG